VLSRTVFLAIIGRFRFRCLQFGTLGRLAGEALSFLGASFWHFASGDCGHEAIPSCFVFEAIPSPF
jgi:hypothetical protein